MGTLFGRYVILLQRYNGEWRAFMAVERDGYISTCDISSFDAIEKFATREAAERCGDGFQTVERQWFPCSVF